MYKILVLAAVAWICIEIIVMRKKMREAKIKSIIDEINSRLKEGRAAILDLEEEQDHDLHDRDIELENQLQFVIDTHHARINQLVEELSDLGVEIRTRRM